MIKTHNNFIQRTFSLRENAADAGVIRKLKMKKIICILLIGLLCPLVFAEVSHKKLLQSLEKRIEEIEKRCTPGCGTTKEDVEIIFGTGEPASNSKITPKVISQDSPYRTYRLCENGVLLVHYREDKVSQANYLNPYSTKGLPLGNEIPIEVKINEAKQRLKQMQTIEEEYLKKKKTL